MDCKESSQPEPHERKKIHSPVQADTSEKWERNLTNQQIKHDFSQIQRT
jgi:hypothetical protein